MTNISLWNPFRDLDTLTNRLFGTEGLRRTTSQPWSPAVDITEDANAYHIVADLPEVSKDGVKVTVEDGLLTIRGERKWEKRTEDTKFHLLERSYGSFTRSFRLPDDAIGDGVSANFKDGSLTVILPKREEAEPKQVEVKID
jgi:HSP20 family protein